MSVERATDHAIDALFLEERRYEPPKAFAEHANAKPDIYGRHFAEFWETEGRTRVSWFEPFDRLLEWEPPYAKWYGGGKLNVCYNCVDRHVGAGLGDKVVVSQFDKTLTCVYGTSDTAPIVRLLRPEPAQRGE